jgi:predicted aspartyl protease
MRGILSTTLVGLLSLVGAFSAQSPTSDLRVLYRTHRWFELRDAVTEVSPQLMRAAVANAFNDAATAERLLRGIIRSQPRSDDANHAYDILSKIYIRAGQYGRFLETYREWTAAFPNSPELLEEKENEGKFRGRPDQRNGSRRHSMLRHSDDDFSLPVSINGKGGEYLFDTGAWQSAMTEQEAKRLGLTVRDGNRVTTDASGTQVSFRTAVAKEVVIGRMRFNDVSFAVLAAPPWAPDAEIGIIGMPILLHAGSIRWLKDGTIELGAPIPSTTSPNLVFHRHRLLLRADILGRDSLAILDTGASTTDFNANFAALFADLIERSGKKGTQEINGIGATQTFESVTLPEVMLTIGPKAVALRPAQVTLQRIGLIGGDCCVANAGQDLLKQGQGFSIDFATMTLQLH